MIKKLLFACLLLAGCAKEPSNSTPEEIVEYMAVSVQTGITEKVKHKGKGVALNTFNDLEPVRVNIYGFITQKPTDRKFIILNRVK